MTLESLERHLWLYESPFDAELIEKAKLTDPAPMTYDGEAITIQHACIKRTVNGAEMLGHRGGVVVYH